ncbi:MAG: hypothetical protein ACE5JR_01455 [Gemmatimonadota bacterium]
MSDAGIHSARTATFRSLVEVFVPEATGLNEAGWSELERLVERTLRARPAAVGRRVRLLLGILHWLPLLRFGRTLPGVPLPARSRLLSRLQDSPLPVLRRGVWGLRTLAFLGYYGRPEVAAEIGYRAHPRGWEARR